MALKNFWNKSLAHVELITFKIHEFINMIVGQLPEEEEKKKKRSRPKAHLREACLFCLS